MSALNTMLSVLSSPSCRLPSAVIVPVACRFPNISTLEFKLIVPVPLAVNSKFALELIVAILLPSICISSTCNLF